MSDPIDYHDSTELEDWFAYLQESQEEAGGDELEPIGLDTDASHSIVSHRPSLAVAPDPRASETGATVVEVASSLALDPSDPWHSRDAGAIFLAELPEAKMLFPGLDLGLGRASGIIGAAGAGKNDAVQSLALSLLSGIPAWGSERFKPTRQGKVIHLTYDMGFRSVALRYRRLANGMGLTKHQVAAWVASSSLVVCEHPEPKLTGDAKRLITTWAARLKGFDLAVLDNIREATPGVDENDSTFGGHVKLFSRACDLAGCVGLYLHHAGASPEATRGRGSSAVEAASGALWFIKGKGNEPRKLTQIRQHDDSDGVLKDFWLSREELDPTVAGFHTRGKPSWKLVASEKDPKAVRGVAKASADASAPVAGEHRRHVLETVQRHPGANGQELYRWAVETKAPGSDLTTAKARRHLEALVESGLVTESGGPNSRSYSLTAQGVGNAQATTSGVGK